MALDTLENVRQGVLERRGPGIIGKWESKWFRVESGTLSCFALDPAGGPGPIESQEQLRGVSNLVLESDKCECTFLHADGIKVRLRAPSAKEAQAWFAVLKAGHLQEESTPGYLDRRDDMRIDDSVRGQDRGLWERPWTGQEQSPESQSTAPSTPTAPGAPPRRLVMSMRRARSCEGEPDEPPHLLETLPHGFQGSGRLLELHALHEARQRKLEAQRLRKEEEELQRIAEEREAMRKGTRSGLNPAQMNAQEAALRLFRQQKESEAKLLRLQRRLEEEERQRLQETRFQKRQLAQTMASTPGVRMYEDHKKREQERQAKKSEKSEELTSEKLTAKPSSVTSVAYYERLYEDAQNRRQQLDRKVKERDAAEAKRLADEALFHRNGPVDMNCLEKLHGDYEVKLKKQALKVAEKQEKERHEVEEAMRSWAPKKGSSGPLEPIWQRGKSAYFIGAAEANNSNNNSTNGKRPNVDLATNVDVAVVAVAHAVQMRCGDHPIASSAELRVVAVPLRAAMKAYAEAQATCEKCDGYPALCVRASQRLFRDCCLVPEFEGFEQCREPKPIHQVEDRIEELMRTAERAQVALQSLFVPEASAMKWQPGETRTSLTNVTQALFALSPGVKARSAAELKARVLFQPAEGARRHRHLLDLARLTLVFPNCDLLHAGLDEMVGKFEVVRVMNHFCCPTRLGERYIEVLLVITPMGVDGVETPHVCEVRLEELNFHKAAELAVPHLKEYESAMRSLYFRPNRDMDALAYISRMTLMGVSEGHGLRQFRRHVAQVYGCVTGAWRRFGGTRLITFERFRDLCHSVKCREFAPVLWCSLDPGCGGCISLFELAPEAVSLMARLRNHILSLEQADDPDDQEFFDRLCIGCVSVEETGRLEAHDFNSVLKPFGFGHDEAVRLLGLLDFQSGLLGRAPSSLSASDLGWLRRLNTIVDLESVLLTAKGALSDHEALGQITRLCQRGKAKRMAGGGGTKSTPFLLQVPAPMPGTARSDRASLSGSMSGSTSARRSRSAEVLPPEPAPRRSSAGSAVSSAAAVAAAAAVESRRSSTASQAARASAASSLASLQISAVAAAVAVAADVGVEEEEQELSQPVLERWSQLAGRAMETWEVEEESNEAEVEAEATGEVAAAESPEEQPEEQPESQREASSQREAPSKAKPVEAPVAFLEEDDDYNAESEPAAAEEPADAPALEPLVVGEEDDDYNAEREPAAAEEPAEALVPAEAPAPALEPLVVGEEDDDYNAESEPAAAEEPVGAAAEAFVEEEDDDYNADSDVPPAEVDARRVTVMDEIEECF